MNLPQRLACLLTCSLSAGLPLASAQHMPTNGPLFTASARSFALPDDPSVSSSSSSSDDSTVSAARRSMAAAADVYDGLRLHNLRPFRAYGISFRLGTNGIGGEIATPLAEHFNLRGGAQTFGTNITFDTDGLHSSGDITLGAAHVSLDYFPFHNGFRISPGLTFHNDNHVFATLLVPPGNSFSLGDADYVSDPTDPIHGTARLTFGNSVAPRFTIGFGNMIPRDGRHWSFPTEIGFQYISRPTVVLSLAGRSCSADGCGDVNSGDGAANIASEQQMLNDDLSPLRFYPILSTGVSFRFGH